MKNTFYYNTAIGKVWILEKDNAVTGIYFDKDVDVGDAQVKETEFLKSAGKQIQEYFAGKRKTFDFPLAPSGTEFQQKVWKSLQEIPYGETRSYGEIANSIGNPKAARAVGMANNRNPISICIPCHRVIGANGKLVGYGGGLHIKEYLLHLEKQNIKL